MSKIFPEDLLVHDSILSTGLERSKPLGVPGYSYFMTLRMTVALTNLLLLMFNSLAVL